MGTKKRFGAVSGVAGAGVLALLATAVPAGAAPAVSAAASQPTVGFTLNTKAVTSPVSASGGVALGLSTASVLQVTNTGPTGSLLVLPATPSVDGVPVYPVATTPTGGLGAVAISVATGSTPGCSGASLLAGQSCDIGLILEARAAGPLSATVAFGGNGTARSFTVDLTGVEGYFIASSGGAEAAFDTTGSGGAVQPDFVDAKPRPLSAPVVATASTQTAAGYYQAAADGGVFAFGDAAFFGSEGGHHLNQPVLGMATHDAKVFALSSGGVDGYWLVAADGGIFSFGNAAFHGSEGGRHLNEPIVGMAATPDGKGYWEVAADGGIFSFGDAAFYGSTGSQHLNQPILGMAATPDGRGYWLVAADGGVFSFGDAAFYGSPASSHLAAPVIGIAATNNGGGYWLAAANAAVFNLGDAPNVAKGFVGTTNDTVGIATYGDPILTVPAAASRSTQAALSPAAWTGAGTYTRN